MTIDDAKLAELEAICEKATPGPWDWRDINGGDSQIHGTHGPDLLHVCTIEKFMVSRKPNTMLIVALRNNFPALIAAIRERNAEIARLRQIVGDIETIRATEGNAVTVCCDNPEAENADRQAAVDCVCDFTDWEDVRYWGTDWATALHAAADAARAHNAREKSE